MIDRVRQRVSLCMIVRNEAQNLAACIESVRSMVSEIIVVDTGSSDGTQQIAADLGAKVIDFPWIDDFAAARNESLKHATGDYILWLDADDRIDEVNAAKLQALIHSLDGRRQTYIFDILCKTPQGAQNAPVEHHPRLFLADSRACWQYRVHEQLLPCLQQLGYEVCWPGIRIDHEGYADHELWRSKALRNLRLCRVEYAVAPDDAAVLFHLGKELVRLGNPREALGYLLKCLRRVRPISAWVARIYGEAVAALNALGRKQEALQMAQQGLEHFGSSAALLFAKAELLCEFERFAEAKPVLHRLIEMPAIEHFDLGASLHAFRGRARSLLGVAHFHLQEFGPAEEIFRQCIQEDPAAVEPWTWLGFIYLVRGQSPLLENVVQQLRQLPSGEAFACCLESQCFRVRNLHHDALASAQRAATLAPAMPLPRMIIAEVLLALQADAAQLREALTEVLRVAPGNDAARQYLQQLDRHGHVQPAHAQSNHAQSSYAQSNHVQASHSQSAHNQSAHAQPALVQADNSNFCSTVTVGEGC
jgi:tetratricopeptide (TPR) repeat protein